MIKIIFVFIFYLFFANHGLRKKDRVILEPIYHILVEKFKLENEDIGAFGEDVPLNYRATFKYLRNTTNLTTTGGNHLTYYRNGETFFPALLESLKNAKEFIFMEFFIIGEGIWWNQIEEVLIEKAKEGVEVRLIYDDMGSFGVIPNKYHEKMNKSGIKCYKFHPFKAHLSGSYNNRDHRKIAIIDHSEAYTGGMNLADEYANAIMRFGYWKDTMVKVEGPGIANFIAIFLENYDLCQRQVSDYDHYLDYDYQTYPDPGYIYFFGDGPGSYSNNEPIGEDNYIQMIDSALKTIWISTPYLIPPYRLRMALVSAAKSKDGWNFE